MDRNIYPIWNAMATRSDETQGNMYGRYEGTPQFLEDFRHLAEVDLKEGDGFYVKTWMQPAIPGLWTLDQLKMTHILEGMGHPLAPAFRQRYNETLDLLRVRLREYRSLLESRRSRKHAA